MIPVMIVEDEFLVRVGLKSMIDWEKYGFYIAADASNGKDALDLYEKYHPYLIITDIRMSPVDGLELIETIRKTDKQTRFIIMSAYNDFEYAQKAIKYGVELYLSKASFKNEEILEVLPRIKESYSASGHTEVPSENRLLRFTDLPGTNEPEKLRDYMEKIGFHSCAKRVLAGRFDRSKKIFQNTALIQNIYEEALNTASLKHLLFIQEDFYLCLCEEVSADLFQSIAGSVNSSLKKYTGARHYFGLSSPFSDPGRIFRAINEACLACNELVMNKAQIFRCYQDISLSANAKLSASKTEALITSVYAEKKEETQKLLHEIVYSAPNYRQLEKNVFTVLSAFFEYENDSTFADSLITIMKKDDLEEICTSLLIWIYQLPFRPAQTQGSVDYVDQLIVYIKENISSDLSIRTLSQQFHLSPNYLGKLFYQKTNVFLNTYIANYRINKACELLIQTDYTIAAIASMVGIPEQHYFSRLFKERMGISPKYYRESFLSSEKKTTL